MGYLLNISKEKIKVLKTIAAREDTSIKALLEEKADEIIKEHGESQNPQTLIESFDREEVMAIPQIYEKRTEPWDKFFKLVDKKEYKELEKAHSDFTKRMNQKYQELFSF